MNQAKIIHILTCALFGTSEYPFTCDALILDENTRKPLLVRHDGRGNYQYQAKWDGEKWEVEKGK